MRVNLHHQTAFATFLQVSVPCSYPCAVAIPAIGAGVLFSGWECWGTYLWVHIMIHGLLMGVEATTRVELDQMVDQ
jgi:hypothetical protein